MVVSSSAFSSVIHRQTLFLTEIQPFEPLQPEEYSRASRKIKVGETMRPVRRASVTLIFTGVPLVKDQSLQVNKYILQYSDIIIRHTLFNTCGSSGMKKSVSPLGRPVNWVDEREFYITHVSRVNENSSELIQAVYKLVEKASGAIIAWFVDRVKHDFTVRFFTRDDIKTGKICIRYFIFSARVIFGVRLTFGVLTILNKSSECSRPALTLIQTI